MPERSTVRDLRRGRASTASRWATRVTVSVLFVIVVLGAVGVFGVHSRTLHAGSGGYRMSVTYPQSARAGLDTPWRVRVSRAGALPASLTLAVTADYFRMFETQGFFPQPDEMKEDGRYVYLVFQPVSDSTTFVLDYDAYIQPSAQIGKRGIVRLLVAGRTMAQISIHTWLVP